MSEFTNGVLFRNRDIEFVKTLTLHHRIHRLNRQWSAILIPDFANTYEPAVSALKQLSNECPLLDFQHAGDHGWAYRIYDSGQIVAWIEVNYELSFNMKVALADERYPNEPDMIIFWNQHPEIPEALQKEVEESEEYKQLVHQMVEHKNVEAFAVFEIDPVVIQQLDELLTAKRYFENMTEPVETFKQLMGFPEMTWISYHYLENQ